MDVLLDAFLIGRARYLPIGAIPRNNGVRTGSYREINNTAVIAQHLKCIARLQYSGNIRIFGHIMSQLPNTFQMRRLENSLILRPDSCYRKQHRRQHGKEITLFHIRMILVNAMSFLLTQI